MLLELFVKGGFLMYPILLCSVLGVAIFLYKFFEIKRIYTEISSNKNLKSIKDFSKVNKDSLSEKDIEVLWVKYIYNLEKWLSTLGFLANISTLLGLTGTVTGMIKTFMVISQIDLPSPKMLAGGIWEALLTTAFGLIVAIPLHFGLHYLEKKIDEILIISREIIIEIKNA